MSKFDRSRRINWVFVLSPLILLAGLVAARSFAWRYFVVCKTDRCESLAVLGDIFMPDNPELRKPNPTDTSEQALKKETQTHEVRATRYSARLTWVFLALVCVVVCVVAIAIGAYMIFKTSPSERFGRHFTWIAALLIAALLWLLFWRIPNFSMPLLIGFLHSIIENTKNIGYAKGIASLIGAVNSLGYAAAVLLGMAMASIIFGTERTVSSSSEGITLDELSRAVKRLQITLYAATIMLVVGILLERALWQWAVAFTSREELAVKTAQNFVGTDTAVDGGFFTLALAAVYLPAAAILMSKADAAKGIPEEPLEKEKALQAHGLNFSLVDSIPRLAAILAPLLAGPIGELFTRLAK